MYKWTKLYRILNKRTNAYFCTSILLKYIFLVPTSTLSLTPFDFPSRYVEKYQMLKSKRSIGKRLMNSLNFHPILPMKNVNTLLIGEYHQNERFQPMTEHLRVVCRNQSRSSYSGKFCSRWSS
jgi:hypothetical protein